MIFNSFAFKNHSVYFCISIITFIEFLITPSITSALNTNNTNWRSQSSMLNSAFDFLNSQQDLFHQTFIIYQDFNCGGNHFIPSGWMGDFINNPNKILDTRKPPENDGMGLSIIEINYPANFTRKNREKWAGIYWQFPENNWGNYTGYNLNNYVFKDEKVTLEFLAKGETGEEYVQFKSGGINRPPYYKETLPYQDSYGPLTPEGSYCDGLIKLHPKWQRYKIDLSKQDLHNVIGPFCVVLAEDLNPHGATFYLDKIEIIFGPKGKQKRLNEPHFIRSFIPISFNPPDMYFQKTAYVYDNALALLAYLARGTPEDQRRAKIIADAFVYVQQHDNEFNDGRIRNAYSSGDLAEKNANGWQLRFPGWPNHNKWSMDEYAKGSDCGNMAWTIIALITYWEKIDKSIHSKYLEAAQKMAKWIIKNAYSNSPFGGFTGGIIFKGNTYSKALWKSTEHNIDLYVAFSRLAKADLANKDKWLKMAKHAQKFIYHMWDKKREHFWTGTRANGRDEINDETIPLDVQAWAVLAMPNKTGFQRALNWAMKKCCAHSQNLNGICSGFEFKCEKDAPNDPHGIWWEGTGQMCVAFKVAGMNKAANMCRASFHKLAFASNGGVFACSTSECFTGFRDNGGKDEQRKYYKRIHIGATSWYIFCELGWNPYWDKFYN